MSQFSKIFPGGSAPGPLVPKSTKQQNYSTGLFTYPELLLKNYITDEGLYPSEG